MTRIEELQKQIQELNVKLEAEIEKRKDVECPFKEGDSYFVLHNDGSFTRDCWEDYECETDIWSQGNVFKTEREAKLESDRRALLTKFKRFRDKCNGDWKPDFTCQKINKYSLYFDSNNGRLYVEASALFNHFALFGYFKDVEDTKVAIELFGDEIKRLFVEVEQ